jgi:hypothetical protein
MTVFTIFVHEKSDFQSNPALSRRDLFIPRVVEGVVEGPKGVKMGPMEGVVLRPRF